LSLTSLLSAPEREVTSPSDFKVVRTVSNAINSLATSERLSRMEQDSNFTQFKNVHTDSIFSGWLYARMTVELSNVYFLAKLATCVKRSEVAKLLIAFETVLFHTNFVGNTFVCILIFKVIFKFVLFKQFEYRKIFIELNGINKLI
jgi:hypothetical protein